jgi:hypothetical protein
MIGCSTDEEVREMSWTRAMGLMLVVAGVVMGCSSSAPPPAKAPVVLPVEKVELGMSLDDVAKQLGTSGEERSYEMLPTNPRPRDAYAKLPGLTKWLVWSGDGSPILILGVVEDKIVYKQVARQDGGQMVVEAEALPEYQ